MRRALAFSIAAFVLIAGRPAPAQDSVPLELQNEFSQKCLSVAGASAAHGARLEHKECGTLNSETIWEFTPVAPGVYRIRNKRSGKCLGVEHQSKNDGAVVTQVDSCDQRRDTAWHVETLALGAPLVVKNRNSQKCLALVTGTQIKQYRCGGDGEHVKKTTWRLVQASQPEEKVKRVFVTSRTYQANFLPILKFYQSPGVHRAGADKLCQEAAAAGQLPGTYRAWLSLWGNPGGDLGPGYLKSAPDCEGMRSSPLADNKSIPYVNVCEGVQVKVANNFADLLDGALQHPISCTEDGRRFVGTPGVWTGTRTDGRQVHYDACKQNAQRHDEACYIADACWNYQVAANSYVESPTVYNWGRSCAASDAYFRDTHLQPTVTQKEYPLMEASRFMVPLRSLVGNAGAKDENWTQYRWLSCYWKNEFRLYCFEQ